MEKKGWLSRQACPTDKRAFEVDLTDEGRRIIQAAIPPHQRAIEETFSVLTSEEQTQLVELLKNLRMSEHIYLCFKYYNLSLIKV